MKAQRAQITLGDIPLNVYLMPDGSYRLAGRNVTDAIEMRNKSLSEIMGVKSLKALPGAGKIFSITGEQVITVPSKYAVEYWHLMALKGNTLAQNLLTQLRGFPSVLTKLDLTLNDIPIISQKFSSSQSKKTTKQIEKEVQSRLQQETGGEVEVVCPVGKIDLLSLTEIIEIKTVKDWKSAVGQILTYGFYYPSHCKRIHLFGSVHHESKELVESHCTRLSIRVTWE